MNALPVQNLLGIRRLPMCLFCVLRQISSQECVHELYICTCTFCCVCQLMLFSDDTNVPTEWTDARELSGRSTEKAVFRKKIWMAHFAPFGYRRALWWLLMFVIFGIALVFRFRGDRQISSRSGAHSPTGDSDENIMEGGVTIRRRKKTRSAVVMCIIIFK